MQITKPKQLGKSSDIEIPIPTLFNFFECIWFLDRNYNDCMHAIHNDSIWKALHLNNQFFLIRIQQQRSALTIQIVQGDTSPESIILIKNYVIAWFDLDKNIKPFYTVLKKDKRLAYMCNDFSGLRLIAIVDLFEALCWSIIGQQINLAFAHTLKRRLVEKFGIALYNQNTAYHIFPKVEVIASVSLEELKAMQFSTRKAEYIIGVAKAFINGTLSRELLLQLPDAESRLMALLSIRGIGIWTANYALMKSLKEPTAIPYGDAGLINALINHHVIKERSDIAKIKKFFAHYKGWESYVVFYLWRSLATKP